jgi:hypothetical protein
MLNLISTDSSQCCLGGVLGVAYWLKSVDNKYNVKYCCLAIAVGGIYY